jgi:hypothetical protein
LPTKSPGQNQHRGHQGELRDHPSSTALKEGRAHGSAQLW